jgi:hypothetical protein
VLFSIQYAVSTTPPLWNYDEHMKELLPEMQEHLNIEIMQSTDPNIPTAALSLITDLTQYVARSNPYAPHTAPHESPVFNPPPS